jgi:hypothetical protein
MGDILGRVGEITELRQKFNGYDGPSMSGEGKPARAGQHKKATKPAKRR